MNDGKYQLTMDNGTIYTTNMVKYNELKIGRKYIREFAPCYENDGTRSLTYMGELLEYTLSQINDINIVKDIKFSDCNYYCSGMNHRMHEIIE